MQENATAFCAVKPNYLKHFGNNLEVFVNDNIFFEKILSEDFRKKLFLENRIYKLG